MTQQLDFFKEPTPMVEQPMLIGPGNALILVPPSLQPVGPEAAERKAARLREIADRAAAKTFENVLNSNAGGSRWAVQA